METKDKGCVYFFRHIGLSPIKIGYSTNESPIDRFTQFSTYAPYGSEIIGFIQTKEAALLEKQLHVKYASKRLNGEWFDITEEDAIKEIDFHSKIEDVKDRNDFQIMWAKHLKAEKEKTIYQLTEYNNNNNQKNKFIKIYLENSKINMSKLAEKLGVTRQTLHTWRNEINKEK